MSEEYLKRLRDAWGWFNDGQCCGQVDCVGICAAPACIFGEALKEFDKAAAEITRLRAELDTARREGMEEAAKIAADFEVVAYQHGNLPANDPHECAANAAREIAASIRAALGGKDE